eukprot:TRINITY_DN44310_c0_g1_i7.p2 TRINITY_DN44310_c0_g1~~TRINITY_DN44310_c0_g1_i7.p2  ORF type:complete len:103 (-),score=25.52 TRINITY_DN44310_c0_g1_i7:57-365(-)
MASVTSLLVPPLLLLFTSVTSLFVPPFLLLLGYEAIQQKEQAAATRVQTWTNSSRSITNSKSSHHSVTAMQAVMTEYTNFLHRLQQNCAEAVKPLGRKRHMT